MSVQSPPLAGAYTAMHDGFAVRFDGIRFGFLLSIHLSVFYRRGRCLGTSPRAYHARRLRDAVGARGSVMSSFRLVWPTEQARGADAVYRLVHGPRRVERITPAARPTPVYKQSRTV